MKPVFARDARATFLAEGVYDNDPDDPGGETFRGIARRHHPEWVGWPIIDAIKAQLTRHDKATMTAALQNHRELEQLAGAFYRVTYWDALRLDEVEDGRIAEELFDQAVHLGCARAARHLQQALNALNRGGALYADIAEDGALGPRTLAALRAYLAAEPHRDGAVRLLCSALNVLQGAHYLAAMRADTVKEKYARGWLARVRLAREAA